MRVAIVNDFEVIVAGLAAMLERVEGVTVVDTVVGHAHVDAAHPVDVALFDTYGCAELPWDRLRELATQRSVRHVAVYTFDFAPESIDRARRCGVAGYLWKGLERRALVRALMQVSRGETVLALPPDPQESERADAGAAELGYRWPYAHFGLTRRESEVLALLTLGLSNAEMARHMFVGPETVKSHLREIYRKIGVGSRAEAIVRALRDPSAARFAHGWDVDDAPTPDLPTPDVPTGDLPTIAPSPRDEDTPGVAAPFGGAAS